MEERQIAIPEVILHLPKPWNEGLWNFKPEISGKSREDLRMIFDVFKRSIQAGTEILVWKNELDEFQMYLENNWREFSFIFESFKNEMNLLENFDRKYVEKLVTKRCEDSGLECNDKIVDGFSMRWIKMRVVGIIDTSINYIGEILRFYKETNHPDFSWLEYEYIKLLEDNLDQYVFWKRSSPSPMVILIHVIGKPAIPLLEKIINLKEYDGNKFRMENIIEKFKKGEDPFEGLS